MHEDYACVSCIIQLFYQELTNAIITTLPIRKQDKPPDLLGPIIKPFTDLIIQIDKKVGQSFWTCQRVSAQESYLPEWSSDP